MKKISLNKIAEILLVVGGLNWAVTLFNFNAVALLSNVLSWLPSLVYLAVGISAVYRIINWVK